MELDGAASPRCTVLNSLPRGAHTHGLHCPISRFGGVVVSRTSPAALGTAVTVRATLRDVDVIAQVRVNDREICRRQDLGVRLGGIGRQALAALLLIPAMEFAPRHTLARESAALLNRHPNLVEWVGEEVRRTVVPAAFVDSVTVETASWRRGLRTAQRFAPYCARSIALEVAPADVDDLVMEATYWGVGVLVGGARGPQEVVAAQPFAPRRFTGASWFFAEQALAATLPQLAT